MISLSFGRPLQSAGLCGRLALRPVSCLSRGWSKHTRLTDAAHEAQADATGPVAMASHAASGDTHSCASDMLGIGQAHIIAYLCLMLVSFVCLHP